jgi:hypothetical protein
VTRHGAKRRTWLCRLVERTGALIEDRGDGARGLWQGLLQRHAAHCAYCRAELEEAVWIRRELQTLARPRAPEGLMESVVARIAAEQAPQPSALERAGWRAAAAVGLLFLALGIGGAVAVWAAVDSVSLSPGELVMEAQALADEVLSAMYAAAHDVGLAGQMGLALAWGLAGCAVAAALRSA